MQKVSKHAIPNLDIIKISRYLILIHFTYLPVYEFLLFVIEE